MRVYCKCVHPNKVIRYLPAWGFPEGVVQQFGVTHHGTFEFLWWGQTALKVQKTCCFPLLDCQKSQNLFPRQSSLKPAKARFCRTLCVLPAGFVEVHGKWVHLKAEDEKDKIRYRKIPKISPSMYKPLQMQAPQTGNAKNPPLNRSSKYKPPGGWYLPSNTQRNKAKMVNLLPSIREA